MANINISNLSGSDLFNDSESFLTEISDESSEIMGGILISIGPILTLSPYVCSGRTCSASEISVGPPIIIKK
jgi:hypothetical protein